MRIIVAGILLSSLVLAACGTNQTEQSNKQPLVKQDNPVIEIEKQQSATEMANSENSLSESTEANAEISSESVAESTSDNPMMKDTGIQAEVKEGIENAADEKAALIVEEGEKDQKAEEEKKVAEPKS